MEAVIATVGALVGLVLWLKSLERRERQRHEWRMALAEKRAEAVKGADLIELTKRVQRLELKGLKP